MTIEVWLALFVLAVACAFLLGATTTTKSAARERAHIDRVNRQIARGALRPYDNRIQDASIVNPNGDIHHLTPRRTLE